jgi:hypothetical protein
MKRTITAIASFALIAAVATMAQAQTGTVAGDDIFFSTSNTNPGPTVGDITFLVPSAGLQTLYVWITMVPTASDPDGGATNGLVTTADTSSTVSSFVGLAVNYHTSNMAVAPLTGASLANPILTNSSPATTRWDNTTSFSSAAGVATIYNVSAYAAPKDNPPGSGIPTNIRRGLTTINTGAVTDPNTITQNYSNGATEAFLLGSVTFNVLSIGSATIAVQPSNQLANPGEGIPAGLQIAKGQSGLQVGDFNGDGVLTQTDLTDLLAAVTDQSAWADSHNLIADQVRFLGDVNGDGAFDNADIQALINKLINPSGGNSTIMTNFFTYHTATLPVLLSPGPSPVPEPATFCLAAIGLMMLAAGRWLGNR